MEKIENKQEKLIRENNRALDNAKTVGLACEDIALDIKVNLKGQTEKMQHSTLKNLYEIQGETTIANRLMTIIKKERLKNRIVLYSVLILLILAVAFIIYNAIFKWSNWLFNNLLINSIIF